MAYNPYNLTNAGNGINTFGGVADWTQPASMNMANPIQQATQAVTAAAPAAAAPATQTVAPAVAAPPAAASAQNYALGTNLPDTAATQLANVSAGGPLAGAAALSQAGGLPTQGTPEMDQLTRSRQLVAGIKRTRRYGIMDPTKPFDRPGPSDPAAQALINDYWTQLQTMPAEYWSDFTF